MKLKSLLTLALTLALGSSVAFAEEDTALTKEMKVVNKNLRTLKRQVEDASKKDENLGLIAASKKAIENSLKLEPAKTKDVPAAEKPASKCRPIQWPSPAISRRRACTAGSNGL